MAQAHKKYKNSSRIGLLLKYRSKQALLKTLFTVAPKAGATQAWRTFAKPMIRKFRPSELEALEGARKFTRNFEGRKIQFFEWGEGTRTALLVHGWEGHAGHFGKIAPFLAEQGFRVIAFDNPAHGLSGGERTSMFDVSKIIATLLREYKPELLVGHSFGSGACLLTLHDNPELHVPKLALITAPDRISDVIRVFTDAMTLNDSAYAHIQGFLETRYSRRFDDLQLHQLAPKASVEKALLIHDKNDRIIPWEYGQRIAQNWEKLQHYSPEGLGHYRILWHEDTLEKLREFV